MKRTVVLVVLTASLSACGTSSSAGASGGVFGTVTAGPTCPVEMANSPCPPGVWSGTVRATSSSGGTYDVQTDAQGNYSLALPPGTYEVIPVTNGGPPTGKPESVTVAAGPMQRVDLQVDTGIR